jgi:hypothetical protein
MNWKIFGRQQSCPNKFLLWKFCGRTEGNHKKLRTVGGPAEIQTQHFPNASYSVTAAPTSPEDKFIFYLR